MCTDVSADAQVKASQRQARMDRTGAFCETIAAKRGRKIFREEIKGQNKVTVTLSLERA